MRHVLGASVCVTQIYSSVNLDLPGGFGGLLPLARLYGQVKQTNKHKSQNVKTVTIIRYQDPVIIVGILSGYFAYSFFFLGRSTSSDSDAMRPLIGIVLYVAPDLADGVVGWSGILYRYHIHLLECWNV